MFNDEIFKLPQQWFKVKECYMQVYQGRIQSEISYRSTGMGAQANVPKTQKVKLVTLACLFVKRKLNYPYNNKSGKTIFSF